MIWFSSGAALCKNTPYGFSKFIQEKLWEMAPKNIYCLRVFGCFGPDELPTRFLMTCIRDGHVHIKQDRYFDFFDIDDLCKTVDYIFKNQIREQIIDAVYPTKYKLSQLAEMIGASYNIEEEDLGNDYTGTSNNLLEFDDMKTILERFKKKVLLKISDESF